MSSFLRTLHDRADRGEQVSPALALEVLAASPGDMPAVLAAASAVKRCFFGDRILLCSIVNARGGACSEDCAFCAQAACHDTGAAVFPLLSAEELAEERRKAAALPVDRVGLVTSGCALDDGEVERIERVIRGRAPGGPGWCASLGALTFEQLARLRQAGLTRFHHNIETAESYFPQVCSTHAFADRIATIRAARRAGLEVCAGGILGMGESREQRLEFAFALAREEVDSIPLNFLIPIPGTRLGHLSPLPPLDILKAVAMVRLVNPRAEVHVCAGRAHLRDLQALALYAGATGIMIGPLLTVPGRPVEADLAMIEDLGLPYARR